MHKWNPSDASQELPAFALGDNFILFYLETKVDIQDSSLISIFSLNQSSNVVLHHKRLHDGRISSVGFTLSVKQDLLPVPPDVLHGDWVIVEHLWVKEGG